MTRPTHDRPAAAVPAILPPVDRILFYILLAVLAVRPMIGEVFERADLALLEALPQVSGPTPATTAGLDCALLVASVVVLARRGRWRCNLWLTSAIGLLLVAVVLSSVFAGDRPRALLAGASLFVGVLGGAALAAMVQARWMRQLVIAALLATGAVTALKCIDQKRYEFPELVKEWETVQKPELLRRGFDPDDPLFINFERRLRSSEPYGFLSHPNITGSGLMMEALVLCGLAVGLVASGSERRIAAVGAAVGAGLVGVALWYTGSLGAIAAGAGGLVALVILGLAAAWCGRHSRVVLTVAIAGYLGIIGLAVSYGVAKGTLPHPSLAFRWYYWQAAAKALPDAPLTGLGRENFAEAYLKHKPPESTEDVSNPHNIWLSLLVELGPLGLLAGAWLSGIVLRTAVRGLSPTGADETENAERVNVARAVPLVLGVLGLHALFSATPFEASGMVLVWAIDVAMRWVLALVVGLWLLSRALHSARGRTWLAAGICAALLAAYAHGLLSFAPLTAGGLVVFVLCSVAARPAEPLPARPLSRRSRAIGYGVGVALVGANLLIITMPTVRIDAALARLDDSLREPLNRSQAQAVLKEADSVAALGDLWRDPATARAAARAAMRVGHDPNLKREMRIEALTAAARLAGTMAARNPLDANAQNLRATALDAVGALLRQRGDVVTSLAAIRSAAEAWQSATELKPADPRARISAGQAWLEVWRLTRGTEAAARARAQFAAARAIDAVRDPHSTARLRASELAVIDAGLKELETAASQPAAPATQPE